MAWREMMLDGATIPQINRRLGIGDRAQRALAERTGLAWLRRISPRHRRRFQAFFKLAGRHGDVSRGTFDGKEIIPRIAFNMGRGNWAIGPVRLSGNAIVVVYLPPAKKWGCNEWAILSPDRARVRTLARKRWVAAARTFVDECHKDPIDTGRS